MYILTTKFGNIGIETTPKGISKIHLGIKINNKERTKIKIADTNLQQLTSLLKSYFYGKKVNFNLKIDLLSLPAFTQKVLRETQKIPYGQTVTYSELARKIGQPNASRAVGQALRANPLPIIIPCHRVIRKDKSLGGYAYGLSWKKRLLQIES